MAGYHVADEKKVELEVRYNLETDRHRPESLHYFSSALVNIAYASKRYTVRQAGRYAVIYFGKKKGWDNVPFQL